MAVVKPTHHCCPHCSAHVDWRHTKLRQFSVPCPECSKPIQLNAEEIGESWHSVSMCLMVITTIVLSSTLFSLLIIVLDSVADVFRGIGMGVFLGVVVGFGLSFTIMQWVGERVLNGKTPLPKFLDDLFFVESPQ